MSDAATIRVRGLEKRFAGGGVQALSGLDLDVGRGEWVAVTGPSGCGKSTLLHLVAALEAPTAGSIRVLGHDLATLRDPAGFRRTQVGLVFQLHNLLPHLSAQRNVEIAMFGGPGRSVRARRARELLAELDLAAREDHPPAALSGGERQRVAIARALANDPPVLLADEPTGNLDPASVQQVIGVIAGLRRRRPDVAVLMVTHDERVAAAADRVVTMRDGHVVGAARARRPTSRATR